MAQSFPFDELRSPKATLLCRPFSEELAQGMGDRAA